MNKEDEKKIPVTVEQVRQFLKENQDPEYREFHSKLLPGTENIMGVRLPILRKFAKQLAVQALLHDFVHGGCVPRLQLPGLQRYPRHKQPCFALAAF